MPDEMFPKTTEEKIAKIRGDYVANVDAAAKRVEKASQKLEAAETRLLVFDTAMEEQETALKTVDERLRNALKIRGVDPNTGEVPPAGDAS
jgi:hypothetical protein